MSINVASPGANGPALAAALSTVAVLPPQAAAATGPLGLTFTQTRVSRLVSPISSMGDELFYDFQQNYGTGYLNAVGGTFSVTGNGFLNFTTRGGTVNILTVGQDLPTVPSFFISADVTFAGNGAASDQVRFGLYKDANNFASWAFDNFASKVSLVTTIAGTVISAASTYTQALAGFTKFGVSLTGNTLSAWGFNGKVWICFATNSLDASIKFTNSLSGWSYAVWGQTDSASVNQTLANFRVSPFGGSGLRDMTWVTYENGEPVVIGGSLFFTATVSAPNDGPVGGYGFGCNLGTFSFDPLSYQIKQVGRFSFTLTGGANIGQSFGGAAGKIVMDRTTASWWVFVSTFGAYPTGITVAYQQLDSCPLYGTQILTGLTVIPGTNYDPDLYWDGSNWWMIYCQSSVHPYYLKAPTIPLLASATPVSIGGLTNNEGGKIRVIGGTPYFMLQDYTTPGWPIYTLASVPALVGRFAATLPANATQAHPNIISVAVPGGTKYYALTFSGQAFTVTLSGALTYSNGETIIFESQIVPGKEFADIRNATR